MERAAERQPARRGLRGEGGLEVVMGELEVVMGELEVVIGEGWLGEVKFMGEGGLMVDVITVSQI